MKELLEKLNQHEKFYLIGTSTDVGKTYVGLKITSILRKQHPNFLPLKPVETGSEGKNIPPDTAQYLNLMRSFDPKVSAKEINFFSTHKACSPHLSEELEQKVVTVEEIISFIKTSHSRALIELAGGLLVPLNKKETQADLIQSFPLPILLVADAGLGSLNHVLLTYFHLKTICNERLYLLLNFFDAENDIHLSNKAYLEKFLPTYTLERN